MATLTGLGTGSGLELETWVTALVNAEKGPLTQVTAQKTATQSKISAYGTLKSALSTFQTTISSLATASKFNLQTATSSDTSLFTATATGSATVGNYSINVTQLAQAHKIASSGFSSTNAVIGSGTLEISFGEYNSTTNTFSVNGSKTGATITIDSSNNTLAGVRDAINSANAGVTASIVNDGSTNGARLVVTSKETGASSSVKISVTDSDGNSSDASGLSQLAYDPTSTAGAGKNMTQSQAATNALLTVDGISVTKSSNTITDAIQGVTINLLKAGTGTATNLNVATDTDGIVKNVQAFVDAYNALDTTIRNLTNFNATDSTKSGVLLGDSGARSISTQMKSIFTQTIDGTSTYSTLSQIGVGFQRDGKLALDSTKLKTALETNFSDISKLFGASGTTTDALTAYGGSSTATKAGTYAVTVTQLATQGTMVGGGAPNLTITAGSNDKVTFSIDGTDYSITLAAGTYASTQALADQVQQQLVSAGSLAQIGVDGGGALKITSPSYGSDSRITLNGGNGASDLFGSATSTTGVNVAGSINGVAATGTGQSLKGATGDDSEGLFVKILGGSTGSRGTITFSKGFASQLNEVTTNLLSDDGLLATRTDGLNSSITRLTKQEEALNDRLDAIEKRYRAQFSALDTLVASMKTTSSYLTQQLAQLSANS